MGGGAGEEAWDESVEDVPHFSRTRHSRTLEDVDRWRRARRQQWEENGNAAGSGSGGREGTGARDKDYVPVQPSRGSLNDFLFVGGVVVMAALGPALLMGGWGGEKDRVGQKDKTSAKPER